MTPAVDSGSHLLELAMSNEHEDREEHDRNDEHVEVVNQTNEIGEGTHSITLREYWEYRPLWLAARIAVTIGSAFVGMWFTGWIGIVLGLIVGAFGYIVGLPA